MVILYHIDTRVNGILCLIDIGNSTTTFSVCNLHIITATTEVNVLARLISSATSTTGITECRTHLVTMYYTAQIWCVRNGVPGRRGIE